MSAISSDWRNQLSQLRQDVQEAEKTRAERKRLEKEKSRDALVEKLKKDTPESIINEFNELKRKCQLAGRKLYPPDDLRKHMDELSRLSDKLKIYDACKDEHKDLFSETMRQTIPRVLGGLKELQASLDKQFKQWEPIEQLLNATNFRARKDEDNAKLVEIAKAFSAEAFGIQLSLPSDYFANEKEGFYVAEATSGVYGYAKYETDGFSFSIEPREKINFRKMARGFLSHICSEEGPIGENTQVARIKLGDPREFKFFQELGFRRDPKAPDGLACYMEMN